MSSEIDICNQALQKLGAERIVSLTQDTTNARECNACYEIIRDAELRAHAWNFAIKRDQLAADLVGPVFGYANSFQLPSDCLRLLNPDSWENYNTLDRQIEGRKILTDESAPLNIRYIYRCEDTTQYDSLFIDAFACSLATQLNEKITQSSSKGQTVRNDYVMAIRQARRQNAFENISADPPTDTWITSRL
jgi:hypothetical protein